MNDNYETRSHDEHLERLLSGALFEYLDKGMIDELEADMGYIIDREIKEYEKKIKILDTAKRRFLVVNEVD